MSWSPVLPPNAAKHTPGAVTLVLGRPSNARWQRMILTLRIAQMACDWPWCRPGRSVNVEAGAGEDAGHLRITANGPWTFRKASGRVINVSLHLPAPPNAAGLLRVRATIEHRIVGEAIIVALPDWARGGAAAPPSDPKAPPPQRYIGISQRVPDPAKAIQQANGARVR